jgi:hypothetical protein
LPEVWGVLQSRPRSLALQRLACRATRQQKTAASQRVPGRPRPPRRATSRMALE